MFNHTATPRARYGGLRINSGSLPSERQRASTCSLQTTLAIQYSKTERHEQDVEKAVKTNLIRTEGRPRTCRSYLKPSNLETTLSLQLSATAVQGHRPCSHFCNSAAQLLTRDAGQTTTARLAAEAVAQKMEEYFSSCLTAEGNVHGAPLPSQ